MTLVHHFINYKWLSLTNIWQKSNFHYFIKNQTYGKKVLFLLKHEWNRMFTVSLIQFSSLHFRCSIVSDSLRPNGLQHARPPCLLPTPGVYPNSYPLSQWCHPIISSSVIPFSCLQSFPISCMVFSSESLITNLLISHPYI